MYSVDLGDSHNESGTVSDPELFSSSVENRISAWNPQQALLLAN